MKFRCSNSVHVFGEKIENAWGLKLWEGWQDPDKDLLFFGMYETVDFQVFNNFIGKKTIFWCGSDVLYLFESPERLRIVSSAGVEHWTETKAQADRLSQLGIKAHIAPSFLENIDNFPLSFKPSKNPHIYLSGHPNREEEYGFNLAYRMAKKFPNVVFHLYGVEKINTEENLPNVICHGWVSNKQFNEDIKNYQGSIRANKNDGASEIAFKAMLMGQYTMTYLPYDYSWQYKTEEDLAELIQRLCETTEPNTAGRDFWINNLNKYPWMK